jgi:hypothetical protein
VTTRPVDEAITRVHRKEWAQLVAGLARRFGSERSGVARTRTTVVLSTKFEARAPGPRIDSDLA